MHLRAAQRSARSPHYTLHSSCQTPFKHLSFPSLVHQQVIFFLVRPIISRRAPATMSSTFLPNCIEELPQGIWHGLKTLQERQRRGLNGRDLFIICIYIAI